MRPHGGVGDDEVRPILRVLHTARGTVRRPESLAEEVVEVLLAREPREHRAFLPNCTRIGQYRRVALDAKVWSMSDRVREGAIFIVTRRARARTVFAAEIEHGIILAVGTPERSVPHAQ